MLTQTQVSRVAVRYRPFIRQFPTPQQCAKADLSSVLRAWSGLGYNRRAKSLHESARTIVDEYKGNVPSKPAVLATLNGVGPYIARAVAAFAYDEHAAPIDSNVRRVLERSVAGQPLSMPRAQKIGDSLIPHGHARDWGLALMDFGSLVCSARGPKCSDCPVRALRACAWRERSDRESAGLTDPRTRSRQATEAFAGSSRDVRGSLLRAACNAPIPADALAELESSKFDAGRVRDIASRLIDEGLLVRGMQGELRLA